VDWKLTASTVNSTRERGRSERWKKSQSQKDQACYNALEKRSSCSKQVRRVERLLTLGARRGKIVGRKPGKLVKQQDRPLQKSRLVFYFMSRQHRRVSNRGVGRAEKQLGQKTHCRKNVSNQDFPGSSALMLKKEGVVYFEPASKKTLF